MRARGRQGLQRRLAHDGIASAHRRFLVDEDLAVLDGLSHPRQAVDVNHAVAARQGRRGAARRAGRDGRGRNKPVARLVGVPPHRDRVLLEYHAPAVPTVQRPLVDHHCTGAHTANTTHTHADQPSRANVDAPW